MNCGASLMSVEGITTIYRVLEEVVIGDRAKEAMYQVIFNRDNHNISCQCLLYKF